MALLTQIKQSHAERRHCRARPHGGFERTAGGGMMKKLLVSVVEADRFFRESMRRLIKSHGYTVEAFPSAADFLGSPRIIETACVISDVNMPTMNGIELYRHLVNEGHSIATILITVYPNDTDRTRALNELGCLLPSQTD
jgi:CheY-like chemotaxis protein